MSTRDYKHAAQRARKASKPPPRWPWFLGGFVTGLLVASGVYLHHYSPQTARLLADQQALRREVDQVHTPAAKQPAAAGKHPGKTTQSDTGKSRVAAKGKSHPRFEFYTLLPEMEVEVPDKALQAAAKKQQEEKKLAAARKQEAKAAPHAPAGKTKPGAGSSSAPAKGHPAVAQASQAATGTAQSAGNAVYMLQVASFRHAGDADRLKASLILMGLQTNIQTVTVNGEETWYRVRVGPFTDIARLDDARARLHANKLDSIVLRVRG